MSLQCLLAVHKKAIDVISDVEEPFDILGQAMAVLSKFAQKSFTIVRLEVFVDIFKLIDFCNGHGLLGSFLRGLVLLPVIGCLVAKKHMIKHFLLSDLFLHIVCSQLCLLVDLSLLRLCVSRR